MLKRIPVKKVTTGLFPALPNAVVHLHSKEVIELLFVGKKSFKELYNSYDSFLLDISAYKDDKDLCTRLFNYLIDHRDDFDYLFKKRFDITYLSEALSKDKVDCLIRFVIDDQEEFNRLVQNDSDLEFLHKAFPNYACIFSQPSLTQAKQVIADIAAIKDTFKVLSLMQDDKSFGLLSNEILLKIATYSRENPFISHDDAYRIARQHLISN